MLHYLAINAAGDCWTLWGHIWWECWWRY